MMRDKETHPVPAIAAVIIDSGKILLVKRKNAPSKDKWSLPGGRIEIGETLISAVKREVMEETGLSIETDGIAGVYDLITQEDETISYHYIIIDFYARITGGIPIPGDDASELKWVMFQDLQNTELAENLCERLLDMIKNRYD